MIAALGAMDSLVEPMTASLVTGVEADIRSFMTALGNEFVAESPRLTGAAADSITAWVGTQAQASWSPKGRGRRRTARAHAHPLAVQHEHSEHREGRGGHALTLADGGHFAEVFASWHLPQVLGVIMTVPYSYKLSQGESQQRAKGWIDLMIADVIAQYQEAA